MSPRPRWALVDRNGRMMVSFRRRFLARRWLTDVGRSNPPAVNGWTIERALYTGCGQTIEAASVWCPDRTVWTLQDDGYWHCGCCGTKKPYRDLVDVRPVAVSSGASA